MKIIADNKIPFLKGVLEPYAEIEYLPGNEIDSAALSNADALLVRTRTRCDENLLKDTPVRFIGTATIGYDHIDTEYCRQKNIQWANAPGCNADSVEQYVTSALLFWSKSLNVNLMDMTIGIIGVGQVGSRVARSCTNMGMNVLLNDPPRERSEGKQNFLPLEEILDRSDIITLHVPLTHQGSDKTFRMVGSNFLSAVKSDALILNTSRGELMDSAEMIKAVNRGKILPPIIDCWENEPRINLNLLERSFIGTAHIAGYSADGKANGTRMTVQSLAAFFNLPLRSWEPEGIPIPQEPILKLSGKNQTPDDLLRQAVLHTYPIWKDDENLRVRPVLFEELRGQYPIRREYKAYTVELSEGTAEQTELLKKFTFTVIKNKDL